MLYVRMFIWMATRKGQFNFLLLIRLLTLHVTYIEYKYTIIQINLFLWFANVGLVV